MYIPKIKTIAIIQLLKIRKFNFTYYYLIYLILYIKHGGH